MRHISGSIFNSAKHLRLALILLVLGSAEMLLAESSNKEVYVVDMQKVIEGSIAGKAAKNNMDKALSKSELKLTKLKNEFEKMREDVNKQSSLLSEQALQDKRDGLMRKERELTRAVSDNREELSKQNNSEIEKIVKSIDQVVKALADQNKYEVVIEKDPRFVLFVEDKFDLTQRVIDELDRRKENMEG